MFTTLLLPLLLAGTPPDAAVRAVGGGDPAIQIWINNDRRFLPGDEAKVQVRTREDGYLLVLHADPDGHLRVLFPLDPRDDNFVRGGRKYEIRGRGGRESFTADNRSGRGTVYAAVSHDPFRFDQFVLGDHWDYRNLAPQRLSADPEPELNDLVRGMVDGGFDYDILTYDVIERVVYASSYGDSYYGDFYGGYGCGYSYFGCHRSYYGSPFSLSVGLFFGQPYHRRYYYDPFFYPVYDPFYDPFFYDPYYYRPYRTYGYYSPYYNYPYYGGGPYRYTNWTRPYTPYRFRTADGTYTGYRDRRYDLGRSVNTVYLPPTVRTRQPVNATPGRRVSDQPVAAAASGSSTGSRAAPVRRSPQAGGGSAASPGTGTARRGVERAPERRAEPQVNSRLTRPNIEARRAREPEERRSVLPDSRDTRGRTDLPTEVRPSRQEDAPRRAVERPQEARRAEERPGPAPTRAEPQQAAPSPSRRDDGGSRGPEARPAPRSEPRSYSPPSRSDGGSRGGMSGGGGDRGGGRRR